MVPDRDALIAELDRLRQAEKLAEKELEWRMASLRSPDADAEAKARVDRARQELFVARQALGVWIQTRGLLLAQETRRIVANNGNLNNRAASL